jgi:tetratricopeptide (TPR) repeat protein
MSEARFKKILAILIAVVTLLTTVIAFLQSESGSRDDRANRDTKRYALEVMGQNISGDARTNYDYNGAYQTWYELDLLARSAATRGDQTAARRYEALRDELLELSPLLKPPYFDPQKGEPNILRYEADTYLVNIVNLEEKFKAASAVKDAWDAKSNTYIVHLTLMAVALFLYGLGATISVPATRWIFAASGSVAAAVAIIWAVGVWAQPVRDLRDSQGAIEAFAQGVGLSHQERWKEAIASFDQAVQAAPDYASAYAERASASMELKNWEAAIADYKKALELGDASRWISGDMAWASYQLGRFSDAIDINRTALQAKPGELWMRFDLGQYLLATGQVDAALVEYKQGMEAAIKEVAEARAAKAEPPSFLWIQIDQAAGALDEFADSTEEGISGLDKVPNKETVIAAARGLYNELKSLAVALEYTGQPPKATSVGKFGSLKFGLPIYDEQGDLKDFEGSDSFEHGIEGVAVRFDYSGMEDGKDIVLKVYVDGVEDPTWRLIVPWQLGKDGTAEFNLTPSYSGTTALSTGEWEVELYVDSHLSQRGGFVVQAQES